MSRYLEAEFLSQRGRDLRRAPLLPARQHRPDPDGLIRGCRHDAPAVGAEPDRENQISMSGQNLQLLAGFRIPQPRGLIRRAGDDRLAIRTEGNVKYIVAVSSHHHRLS